MSQSTLKAQQLLTLVIVSGLLLGLANCRVPEPAGDTTLTEMAEETGAEVIEPADPSEESSVVFKLGVLGPFSGPSAHIGEEFKAAVNMAFGAIGWQIGPYRIEPVWIDSQSDAAKAAQAYERAAVQDGIQAGLLNWHASVAVSCMEVAAEHRIPHFAACGAAGVVNETWQSDPDKYFYWVNKWWPTPKQLSVSFAQALEDAIAEGVWAPEEKTFAVYGEDTDWGRGFGEAIKEQLEATGWTAVAEDYFEVDQREFYQLLDRFEGLGPAVIAGTTTALPSFSSLIRQADEVGLESLIIAYGLGWFGEWYESTGDSSNYVLDQSPVWATGEGMEFAARFAAENGFPASPSGAGLAYDASRFFIEAARLVLATTGELSKETLADFAKNEIQTGNWSFTNGIVMSEYKYTPETVPDPVVGRGYYIFPVLQYFDGEGKVIYPPEWAAQQLQPKP